MDQELLEKMEFNALKTYALSIGVDKVRILLSQTKEDLHKLISEYLEEIIDKNVGASAEYKELCDFAISIDAYINNCIINDNICVIKAIKEKIMSLHIDSLTYELNFLKYLNDIRKLNELIREEHKKTQEFIHDMATKAEKENEQSYSQGFKLR